MKAVTRLVIALALASGLACARTDWIDRTLVTENVTGVWSGTVAGRAVLRFDLQHEGPKVTGFIKWFAGGSPEAIEGSVAGDVFTFKNQRGSVSGELTVGGDDMTGQISGWVFGGVGTRSIFLHRESVPSQTNPPTR